MSMIVRERQVIRNARLFDSAAGVFRPHTTLVIEGDSLVAVTQEPIAVDDAARRTNLTGNKPTAPAKHGSCSAVQGRLPLVQI